MHFLGTITGSSDLPGIKREAWVELIASHQNLAAFPDHEGLNPFTKAPMIYRADPASARVMVDGAEVGTMEWAQDGSRSIGVMGEAALVEPFARAVASRLGGIYRRGD